MVNCAICNKEFKADKNLHFHIKAHKLSISEYYQSQFPRYDLYDKKIIKFKNKDQYLSADFNNKGNLKKWLKKAPLETAKRYCKALLTKRKREKELRYTPTEVELRTLMVPPIPYYQLMFGDYYALCEEIGFENKFRSVPPSNL